MKTDQPMNDKLKANAILYVGEKIKAVDLPTFTETFEFFESKLKEKDEEIAYLNKRLNASSLLYKDSIKEIETHINEKVHWFNCYTDLKSQLQASNSMADRLAETIEDMLNCCDMDSTSFASYNKILTEYQNSKK